jgi:hypothetical protein
MQCKHTHITFANFAFAFAFCATVRATLPTFFGLAFFGHMTCHRTLGR